VDDFQNLIETFIELFGRRKNVFFDEIQNVRGWELFINRMLREGYRVFITGSNSNLLSQELGTHLTGRHIDLELYPFSFQEYLRAKDLQKIVEGDYNTSARATLSAEFNKYFLTGGMPEVVLSGEAAILTHLINDVIQKDIVTRYSVRKPAEIKKILRFILANVSNETTYRGLTIATDSKSENTVKKYIQYLEETYIIFEVSRYDKKLRRRDKNPKKFYCIDNGIIINNVPTFIENKGGLLENMVAINLKRMQKEFYFFRDKDQSEADFVIPSERQIIQVCYELNEQNRKREIKGLVRARREINAEKFLIITLNQEESIKLDGLTIDVEPIWLWLAKNH
jgi:predicted AAA+ superfamily ATPase